MGGGHFFLRKIRSLYVPAVLWILVSLLVCTPIRIYSGHNIPTLWRIPGAFVLWVDHGEAGHFWYVRSLLFLFACAPTLRILARRWYAASVVILFFAFIPIPGINSIFGSYDLFKEIEVAIPFFLLGAVLASTPLCLAAINKRSRFALAFSLVGLALSFLPNWTALRFGQILFLWGLYDVLDRIHPIPKMPRCLSGHFFVFCVHLMVIGWVAGTLRVTLGTGPVARLVAYFASIMTFWFDLLLANLVARYFPRVYAVLSGGRT